MIIVMVVIVGHVVRGGPHEGGSVEGDGRQVGADAAVAARKVRRPPAVPVVDDALRRQLLLLSRC